MSSEVNTKQVYGMIANVCLGSLFFGYTMAVFNSLSQIMINLNGWKGSYQETLYPTLITISTSIGCTVSAPFGDKILQYLGGSLRRGCIYLDLLSVVSVLIQLIDSSFEYLLFGRFIAGIVIGLNCLFITVYISEFSPVSMRGITGCTNQIFICSGFLISFIFGLFLPSKADLNMMESYTDQSTWRINIGFSMSFGILRALLLSTYFNNDSPSQLHKDNRIGDLKALFQRIYLRQEKVIEMIKDLDNSHSQKNQDDKELTSTPTSRTIRFDDHTTKSYKRRFILGIVFSISNQLTGINAVMFYSNKIFEDSHQEAIAGYCTCSLGLILVFSTVYAAQISEIFGRRQMMMIGGSLMTVCLFLIGIFSSQNSFIFSFLSICLYLFFFSTSTGPLVWAYQGEILDSTAMSISTGVIWLFTLVVGLVFPYLLIGLGIGGTFIFFGVLTLISIIYFSKELIETKGKSKEQICLEFEGISEVPNTSQNKSKKSMEKPLLLIDITRK